MLVKQDALDGRRSPNCTWFCNEPNDHPHGGGEGRAPIGRPSPMSPWGKPTLGKKTRRGKNLLTNLSFVDVRKIILKLIWVCGVKLHAHNKKGGANGS